MEETGDLKIVITKKGAKWRVGVQAPECDPFIQLLDAVGEDAGPALEAVTDVVASARAKWAVSKLNPKGEVPKPPPLPPPAPRTTAGKGKTPTKTEPTKTEPTKPIDPQQPMF